MCLHVSPTLTRREYFTGRQEKQRRSSRSYSTPIPGMERTPPSSLQQAHISPQKSTGDFIHRRRSNKSEPVVRRLSVLSSESCYRIRGVCRQESFVRPLVFMA